MEGLVTQIEKMKPFFEKISRNVYLRAIRDGFIAAMPIVLFSSIFMLIAFVPNIFGFHWPSNIEEALLKPYDYSMGIFALVVAATTAKSLTDAFNRHMPRNNQINNISTMIGAMVSFLILSSDPLEGGFSRAFTGSSGLPAAFIVAFVVANVYKVFIRNNITIKLPEEVPPNISQTFKDLIPFGVSILIFWLFDLGFRSFADVNFAQAIIKFLQPIFTAADGYLGLALIYGAMAFFWFIGIHGPSIVEPAVAAIYYVNVEANFRLLQSGEHAAHVLTPGLQQFVATLGGTGATLVITLMFAFMAKSKQLKAVGRASSVPVLFGVNEPFLFGAPVVLNPVFFIPFILTPIVNVWVFKFFVDVLKMNSFMHVLPWTTPGPIGLILGTGISVLAILLSLVLLVVDFIIYYPFFKVYDRQRVEIEKENLEEEHGLETSIEREPIEEVVIKDGEAVAKSSEVAEGSVLVLCAGGGTSGQLANVINKGAAEAGLNIEAGAGAYGAHMDLLKDYDMVILAPQVASNFEDIKIDTDKIGVKLVSTSGKEYIDLTRDSEKALKFTLENMKKDE